MDQVWNHPAPLPGLMSRRMRVVAGSLRLTAPQRTNTGQRGLEAQVHACVGMAVRACARDGQREGLCCDGSDTALAIALASAWGGACLKFSRAAVTKRASRRTHLRSGAVVCARLAQQMRRRQAGGLTAS